SPTRYDSTDGKMAGTTAQMEYKLASSGDDVAYVTCTESDTVLATGTYLIRYAPAHGFDASEPITLTVPAYVPIQLTATAPSLTTSRTYDGNVAIEGSVTTGDLIGIQGTDEVIFTGTATYADKHAGIGKTITVTYTLGGADAGNYIKPVDVQVTGTILQKELTVSGTDIVSSKVYDGLPTVSITDNGALVGKVSGDEVTAEASASYSNTDAGTGKPVTITYTLSGADAGNYLINDDVSKTANITKATYDMSTISFSNTEKVYDGNVQSLQISGTLPAGVTVAYIDNANTNVGNYSVTARFTGDSTNYEMIADKSAILTIDKASMEGSVDITGTTEYGDVLTANTNLTNAGTPTYQWKRSGVAIEGATGLTYTLGSADIGASISVTVTAGGGNYQGSIESLSSSDITRATMTGTVSISGTTKYGETLTANTNLNDAGNPTYQWKRGGVAISGATGSTYTLGSFDIGSVITVQVTAGGDNWQGSLSSSSTSTIDKATYDMSGISFTGSSTTYDGNAHSLQISGTLPSGVTVHYAGNGKVNVGEYSVTADFIVDNVNYEAIPDKHALLTITKATYDMSAISFIDSSTIYDGNVHSLQISGTLPSGVSVHYTGNGKTNAGEYSVTASFTGDSVNYEAIADRYATLTINKATYDMSNISLIASSTTYDGNPHSLQISGTLPSGVAVQYFGNGKINAGEHSVVAIFTGDGVNYNTIAYKYAKLTINKATYDMSAVTFSGGSTTYDGEAHSLFVSNNLPSGVAVVYSGNAKTNAGDYSVTASFIGDSANYEAIADKHAMLTINKATYDMSTISFNNALVTYDGSNHSLLVSGTLPSGVVAVYTGNGKTNTGDYSVTASFRGDGVNYEAIADMYATLTIERATMSGTVSISGTTEYGAVLTANIDLVNAGNPIYQWKRGGVAINGANGTTYTLDTVDIGASVSVTVIAGGTNYEGVVTSSASAVITKATISGTVSISGTTEYGSVLTSITNLTNAGIPTYQWKRSGVAIVGATNTTYTLVSADIGTTISVAVTAGGDNYQGSMDSSATSEIKRKELTVWCTFSGKTYDGTTAATGNLSLIGVVGSDDVGITGVFRFADPNAGNMKTVNVTDMILTGTKASNYSLAQTTYTGAVTIYKKGLSVSATADVKAYDGTTAATGSLSLTGVVGSDEVSATGTFAFTDVNAGSSKTVYVTGITLIGAKASNYSVPATTAITTTTITKALLSGSVSISGNTKFGEVLTAVPSLNYTGTLMYQWKRGGVVISGATQSTYILAESDIGSTITVTVSVDTINYQGSITSLATIPIEKRDGASINDSIIGYYPSLPATQTTINFTNFTVGLTGLEASIALNGSSYGSYADIEVDSRGRAMVLVGSAATTATKVKVRKKETSTTNAGPETVISISEKALSVGDYYQGGVVAYFFMSGDTGFVSGQLHGLIAAKSDSSTVTVGIKWSDNVTLEV
ncbi:MAG: YDG domain-containing protein, partial [Sphaerochaeta sp.]